MKNRIFWIVAMMSCSQFLQAGQKLEIKLDKAPPVYKMDDAVKVAVSRFDGTSAKRTDYLLSLSLFDAPIGGAPLGNPILLERNAIPANYDIENGNAVIVLTTPVWELTAADNEGYSSEDKTLVAFVGLIVAEDGTNKAVASRENGLITIEVITKVTVGPVHPKFATDYVLKGKVKKDEDFKETFKAVMREETKKFVIQFEGGNGEFKKLEGKDLTIKGHAICRNVHSDPSTSKVKITLQKK